MSELRLLVNGTQHQVDAPPMKRLLDVLREELELTGTKDGCGEGECGACSVLIDGTLANSCLVPVFQVEGVEVTTIEGLSQRERLHPLQRALVEHGGAQCGICAPGMIMAASVLPANATLMEVREGLAGNLCRCTGYDEIYRAVLIGLAAVAKTAAKQDKKKVKAPKGDKAQKPVKAQKAKAAKSKKAKVVRGKKVKVVKGKKAKVAKPLKRKSTGKRPSGGKSNRGKR